jgi:hypothetical protein
LVTSPSRSPTPTIALSSTSLTAVRMTPIAATADRECPVAPPATSCPQYVFQGPRNRRPSDAEHWTNVRIEAIILTSSHGSRVTDTEGSESTSPSPHLIPGLPAKGPYDNAIALGINAPECSEKRAF